MRRGGEGLLRPKDGLVSLLQYLTATLVLGIWSSSRVPEQFAPPWFGGTWDVLFLFAVLADRKKAQKKAVVGGQIRLDCSQTRRKRAGS